MLKSLELIFCLKKKKYLRDIRKVSNIDFPCSTNIVTKLPTQAVCILFVSFLFILLSVLYILFLFCLYLFSLYFCLFFKHSFFFCLYLFSLYFCLFFIYSLSFLLFVFVRLNLLKLSLIVFLSPFHSLHNSTLQHLLLD